MTGEGTLAAVLAGEARWTVICGDNTEVLPGLPDASVDHVITDPPYGEHVHASVRSSGRNGMPDGDSFACRTRRSVDLTFDHLTEAEAQAREADLVRICRRWRMYFSDVETCSVWRAAAGKDYVRTGAWLRIGGAPQFSGDRPAAGFEAITIAHRKGRKHWNGGGKAGVWAHAIVANRLGQRGSRVHTTQKPIDLMLDLVRDFTDPDDLILDPYCGSGTTLVAALRLGRRAIGIELNPEWAALSRDRLRAEESDTTLQAARAGQGALFGMAEMAGSEDG